MPSFEWNKIIASVLTAMIVAMVAGILSSKIVAPTHLEKPAYMPPGAAGGGEGAAPQAAAAQPAGPEPIAPYLVKADPAKGQQFAKVCLTCHTFEKGGPNKIGPNLWGVAAEKIAAVPNYQFSPALQKHKGEEWTPSKLNHWLFNPQHFAAGTKMSFPGLKQANRRADVIAYLETLTPGGEGRLKEIKEKAAAAAQQKKAAPAGSKEAAPAGGKEAAPAGGKEAAPAASKEAAPAASKEAAPAGGKAQAPAAGKAEAPAAAKQEAPTKAGGGK